MKTYGGVEVSSAHTVIRREELRFPLCRRLGGIQNQFEGFGGNDKYLLPPGVEPCLSFLLHLSVLSYTVFVAFHCDRLNWILSGQFDFLERKRPLGRPRHRWKGNIKIHLQEVRGGCGDWMELAQDRDRWRELVSTLMNLRVPKMRGIS